MYKYSVLSAAILPFLLSSPAANADTSVVDVTQIGKVNQAYVAQLSDTNIAQVNQLAIANLAKVYQVGNPNIANVNQAGNANRSWVGQINANVTSFNNVYYLFIYQKDGYNLLTYGPTAPVFSRLGRLR